MVETPGIYRVPRKGPVNRDDPFARLRFDLTDEHVTLLRAMYVEWQDDEWGAPEIDPKRPYGNSDLYRDIWETLHPATHWDAEHGMPRLLSPASWQQERARLEKLHRETRVALQIVLRTGSFEPGTYECREYHEDWQRVDGPA